MTNVLAQETKALKARVKTSAPHSYTCSYTSDFKAELVTKLLLTGAHLRKRAVPMFSYTPARS